MPVTSLSVLPVNDSASCSFFLLRAVEKRFSGEKDSRRHLFLPGQNPIIHLDTLPSFLFRFPTGTDLLQVLKASGVPICPVDKII